MRCMTRRDDGDRRGWAAVILREPWRPKNLACATKRFAQAERVKVSVRCFGVPQHDNWRSMVHARLILIWRDEESYAKDRNQRRNGPDHVLGADVPDARLRLAGDRTGDAAGWAVDDAWRGCHGAERDG